MTHRRVGFAAVLLLGACGSSTGGDDAVSDAAPPQESCAALEAGMRSTLDAAAVDTTITAQPEFTLLLEADDGRRFTHSHGASEATTVYQSASTSKWVTAAVLLDLVDQGKLSLATTAHDELDYWTETTVTLRDLLSFTSGFSDEPLCIDGPSQDFDTCVQTIYTKNEATAKPAGSEFYYSSAHMQVAGAMAIRATGLASWSAIFDAWRARTQLFPTGAYDLPSATNPRLAGGMHWNGEEYLAFLRKLRAGEILQPATLEAMLANQRGAATVGYSPLVELGEDWSYGLGNWLECPSAATAGSFDCGEGHRNSSPGAYGAYPFIDFDHGYVGILARQGTSSSAKEGIAIVRTVEDDAARWAQHACAD